MARNAARSSGSKDPALPQTRRARRRLIGAAALAIAAAIVLTLVLDSEPRGTVREVEVTIPSRTAVAPRASEAPVTGTVPPLAVAPPAVVRDGDRAVEGRVAGRIGDADDESPRMPPAALPPAVEHDEPARSARPVPPPVPPDEPVRAEGHGAGTEGAATGSPAKRRSPGAGGSAAASGATAANGTAASRESGTARGKAPEAPAARGQAAGRAEPARTAREMGRYSVQVGAFSSDETARAQAGRVREAGLPVYTERVITSQGARIRVRAGPFETSEEAERASARLTLAGIESAIIKP